MEQFLTDLPAWATSDAAMNWLRALILLAIGVVAIRVATSAADRFAQRRWSQQGAMLLRRGVSLLGWALLSTSLLHQLGFNLGVLMGAAGVLTVAAGFASQTAASNLISGLFLIGERPFVVGDVITVDDVTGEVTDIDLVSVKIRTFDNLMVRVPNEMLLKSRITNLSAYPIRRIDLQLSIAYRADVEAVMELLKGVANDLPVILDEPEPVVMHKGFGDSAVHLQFSAWAVRSNFLAARNCLQLEVHKALNAHGVEIPFPQRTLSVAPDGGALTVRVERGE